MSDLDEHAARTAGHAGSRTSPEAQQRRIAQLESELRNARAEARAFRELAEHIHEVFWMTTALGDQLVYISPAYEAIWGQTCNSLYADPGRRLAWVHDRDRERVLAAFKRDARHGRYDETYRIDRPDGEIRWIRDRAWRVYNEDGELYRLAGFATDITDDMAAQDRIDELGDKLAISERFGVFAALGAGLAHDLSQPLTAARTHLARVGGNAVANDVGRAVSQADNEIGRASEIVGHLRDYAKQGRPSVVRQTLGTLLGEIHRLSDAALRREHIRYHTDVDDATADREIVVDRVFVQQILRNLIQNAVEALAESDLDPDARVIRVSAGLDDEHLEVRVADNGQGMAVDVNPFSAFDSTKLDGLGIGLHVSRSLARSHGGDLFVAAPRRNDMRTAFVLRLPIDGRRTRATLPPSVDLSVAGASGA